MRVKVKQTKWVTKYHLQKYIGTFKTVIIWYLLLLKWLMLNDEDVEWWDEKPPPLWWIWLMMLILVEGGCYHVIYLLQYWLMLTVVLIGTSAKKRDFTSATLVFCIVPCTTHGKISTFSALTTNKWSRSGISWLEYQSGDTSFLEEMQQVHPQKHRHLPKIQSTQTKVRIHPGEMMVQSGEMMVLPGKMTVQPEEMIVQPGVELLVLSLPDVFYT